MPKIRDDKLPTYVYRDGPGRFKIAAPTPRIDARTGKPARTTIRKDADGNALDTVQAAVLELAKRTAAVAEGTAVYDGGLTVERWLNDWHQRRVDSREIRPTSAQGEKRQVNKIIARAGGKTRLKDFTPAHAKRVIDGEPVEQEVSRLRVYVTMRTALEAAVFEGLLLVNPMRRVKRPKVAKKRVQIWSMADTRRFLDHARADRYGVLFALAFNTGLRRGELLGLKWGDYGDARLTIRRQLLGLDGPQVPVCEMCGERHRGAVEADVKTEAAEERVVELTRAMSDLIDVQRMQQTLERDLAGPAWLEHGYIFATALGGPLKPANLTRRFRELGAEIGLTGHLHMARHTHASALLASGAPLDLVSRRLGHSSIAVTHNVYSHLVSGVSAQAAERAAALFSGDPVSVNDLSAGGDHDADSP